MFEYDPFRRDEKGASGTEYALIVAFLALVAVLAASILGLQLTGIFSNLAGVLNPSVQTDVAVPGQPSPVCLSSMQSAGFDGNGRRSFSTAQSFTIGAGCTKALAKIWAAGGGSSGAGTGGGGSFVLAVFIVSAGDQFSTLVGQVGSAGVAGLPGSGGSLVGGPVDLSGGDGGIEFDAQVAAGGGGSASALTKNGQMFAAAGGGGGGAQAIAGQGGGLGGGGPTDSGSTGAAGSPGIAGGGGGGGGVGPGQSAGGGVGGIPRVGGNGGLSFVDPTAISISQVQGNGRLAGNSGDVDAGGVGTGGSSTAGGANGGIVIYVY